MPEKITPRWLDWAREIQALAQTSFHYSENVYQQERSKRLLAIAAEIVHEHTLLPREEVLCSMSAPTGYATPRVDVRAAIFQDGKLLLVRERADNGWTMPGGWADVGDIPSKAAEREAWEESGYKVQARKVIGVYDANRTGPLELFHAFKLLFLCDLIAGAPTPSIETSEVAFFERGEIPAHLSGERTRPRQIEDAFAALADPDGPTAFD